MANNKKTEKKGGDLMKEVGIGVGLTAAAVAAAGAYFLYGSDKAAKNRKAVKSWALKAKAEVLEKLEDAKEMTQDEYEQLVMSIASAYSGAKAASKKDVLEFASEMTQHWKQIEKAAKPLKKQAKKTVSVVKKEAKGAMKDVKTTAKKVTKAVKKDVKK